VTRQTIVAIEAGDYAPSVYLALALAHHLGGSVEDLFAAADAEDTEERHGGDSDDENSD
jgi:putative transcriptional regulator